MIKHTDSYGDSFSVEAVRDGSLLITAIDGDTDEVVYIYISAADFSAMAEKVGQLTQVVAE